MKTLQKDKPQDHFNSWDKSLREILQKDELLVVYLIDKDVRRPAYDEPNVKADNWRALSANVARWMWDSLSEDLKDRIKLNAWCIRRGFADTLPRLYDEIVKQMEGEEALVDMNRIEKFWFMKINDSHCCRNSLRNSQTTRFAWKLGNKSTNHTILSFLHASSMCYFPCSSANHRRL
ncbi:hypothetical protein N7540_004632 [Penicillium herquei]|nr:hypothetical protein N7540_004632 [Penicillium herquei]